MALGKKTTPKKATPAAKTPKTPVIILLSDKEKVLSVHDSAVCISCKTGFVIINFHEDKEIAAHSGIAKSELDAWKLAAHNL